MRTSAYAVLSAGIILAGLVAPLVAAGEGDGALKDEHVLAESFTISSRRLAVEVMQPAHPLAAYRGPRFESGGLVLQVKLDGRHTFLGKEPRGKRLGGIGLCEEMGIDAAIGYDEAKPGEPFLKLGIGLIRRGERPKYSFYDALPDAERFLWQVRRTKHKATFVQVGKPFRGIAYRYEKQVVLDPEKPVLRLEHELRNTGEKPIGTTQYCHNFLRFGDAPPGPDYLVTVGFPLKPRGEAPAMQFEGQTVRFRQVLTKPAYCQFDGQPPTARTHTLRVRNEKTGLEMVIGGDFPAAYMAYYADTIALSPETFLAIEVAPGKTLRWTRTYTFGAK